MHGIYLSKIMVVAFRKFLNPDRKCIKKYRENPWASMVRPYFKVWTRDLRWKCQKLHAGDVQMQDSPKGSEKVSIDDCKQWKNSLSIYFA